MGMISFSPKTARSNDTVRCKDSDPTTNYTLNPNNLYVALFLAGGQRTQYMRMVQPNVISPTEFEFVVPNVIKIQNNGPDIVEGLYYIGVYSGSSRGYSYDLLELKTKQSISPTPPTSIGGGIRGTTPWWNSNKIVYHPNANVVKTFTHHPAMAYLTNVTYVPNYSTSDKSVIHENFWNRFGSTTPLIYIVSDLHLGPFKETDDFDLDRSKKIFVEFIKKLGKGEMPTVLVLNGDIFDFWKLLKISLVPERTTHDYRSRLIEMLKYHKEIMTALQDFLSSTSNYLFYIVGNHDDPLGPRTSGELREPKVDFHELRKDIMAKLKVNQSDQRMHFGVQLAIEPYSTYICHGHQLDEENSVFKHRTYFRNRVNGLYISPPKISNYSCTKGQLLVEFGISFTEELIEVYRQLNSLKKNSPLNSHYNEFFANQPASYTLPSQLYHKTQEWIRNFGSLQSHEGISLLETLDDKYTTHNWGTPVGTHIFHQMERVLYSARIMNKLQKGLLGILPKLIKNEVASGAAYLGNSGDLTTKTHDLMEAIVRLRASIPGIDPTAYFGNKAPKIIVLGHSHHSAMENYNSGGNGSLYVNTHTWAVPYERVGRTRIKPKLHSFKDEYPWFPFVRIYPQKMESYVNSQWSSIKEPEYTKHDDRRITGTPKGVILVEYWSAYQR